MLRVTSRIALGLALAGVATVHPAMSSAAPAPHMRAGDPNPTGAPTSWRPASSDPQTIWRIGATDAEPAITTERLALCRDFVSQGGRLGMF